MRFILSLFLVTFLTPLFSLAQESPGCCDWGSNLNNPTSCCPDCLPNLLRCRVRIPSRQEPDPGNIISKTCEVIENVGGFVGDAAYEIGDTLVCSAVETGCGLFNFCHAGVYVFFWWSGVVPKPAGVQ